MSKAPPPPPRPSDAAVGTLLASSVALAGLAVYQWMELLVVRAGGTPACAVNETFNCAAVWNTAFAGRIHDLLGIPVAGLGVLYGVIGAALAATVYVRGRRGLALAPFVPAVKLWAAAGVLSCVTFISASLQAGSVCLTCLGTYVLTAAYAFGAFKLLPGPWWPDTREAMQGGGWALVITVPVFLVLLWPGGNTPKSTPSKLDVKSSGGGAAATDADFDALLAQVGERDKLQAAFARDVWLKSEPKDVSAFSTRLRRGPPDAPVKIVEFTDILCGHCRMFEGLLEQIQGAVPPGRISVEPRYFPLDKECNPDMQHTAGDGVRCLGAKVQICLEQNPRFFDVRHQLFEQQATLTKDRILDIATTGAGISREALMACVASRDTEVKLAEDIAYAKKYDIEGTPLVLLNGRVAPAAPLFLVGMALSGGDANAAFFQKLPPAPRE